MPRPPLPVTTFISQQPGVSGTTTQVDGEPENLTNGTPLSTTTPQPPPPVTTSISQRPGVGGLRPPHSSGTGDIPVGPPDGAQKNGLQARVRDSRSSAMSIGVA